MRERWRLRFCRTRSRGQRSIYVNIWTPYRKIVRFSGYIFKHSLSCLLLKLISESDIEGKTRTGRYDNQITHVCRRCLVSSTFIWASPSVRQASLRVCQSPKFLSINVFSNVWTDFIYTFYFSHQYCYNRWKLEFHLENFSYKCQNNK